MFSFSASVERRFQRKIIRRVNEGIELSLPTYPICSTAVEDQRPSLEATVSSAGDSTRQDHLIASASSLQNTTFGCQSRSVVCDDQLTGDVSGSYDRHESTPVHNDIALSEALSDIQDHVLPFRRQLQRWAVESGSSHNAMYKLSILFRTHSCFSSLPRSARALLEVPRKALGIERTGGGEYCHFGIVPGVLDAVGESRHLPRELALDFDINGIPIAKISRNLILDNP